MDGEEHVLKLQDDVTRFIINPDHWVCGTRLLFAPRFAQYDFHVCYSSTSGRVGDLITVRVLVTDPDRDGEVQRKHRCRLVVAITNRKGTLSREVLFSNTPDIDGAFLGLLEFDKADVYYCNVQADFFNIQDKSCKISIGSGSLLSIFKS
tara:strand:- start:348 stop:797 length:450 start_codon:yes stop_codon:yes gene_type:complete